MSKHAAKIEWHILDEELGSSYATALPELTAEMPASNQKIKWIYLASALLALLLLSVGTWLWVQAQRGVEQIETELQDATKTELWVAANHGVALAVDLAADPMAKAWHLQFKRDDSTLTALQAIASGSKLDIQFGVLELDKDWAKVLMTINAPGNNLDYQQTRFYRQAKGGWLRTAPTVERWGSVGSLESDSFVFSFHQEDAEVVTEVAPQVDALYTSLRYAFGLAKNDGDAKHTIVINPQEMPQTTLLGSASPDHYVVASPSLYLAPITITHSELILQSLALQFVPDLLDEATVEYHLDGVNSQMGSVLLLWLLWNLDLPLASGHEEIVQWRLTGLQEAKYGEEAPLPRHYAEQCALLRIWLFSPTLLSIPLTCDEQDHAPMIAPVPDTLSTNQLEKLAWTIFWINPSPQDRLPSGIQPGDRVILTTLLEYLVSRYGNGILPTLLTNLGKHKSWTTLSPAVFGLSGAEFAAGWRDYLETHYGLAEER